MSTFARRLLAWYGRQARTLPWRGHPDPYAVWVSEIMLQQTRVATVIPYFRRWMERFPTVDDLAISSEQDVLNLWEGLGYYSRARNFLKAAKIVADRFDGQLPGALEALRQLPGIGRYTAGAIASMAFGLDEPTLDGNIRRVFARVFDIDIPVHSALGERALWNLAAEHLPKGRAGDYNQALMDLGAMICLPKKPQCLICPALKLCKAQQQGIQDQRPVLKPKRQGPHHVLAAAVIVKNGRVLLAKRPSEGLLGGMWEFPNGQVDGASAGGLANVLRRAYQLEIRRRAALGTFRHAYSHFKVTVHVFRCELVLMTKNQNLKWARLKNLEDFPMGKVDRQISRLSRSRFE
ncbi:MAG TPA: A/G-specific adenine glycosylase [Anaerolineales bacterium]|nr:A/G-specific adenine glycosylase [Anaerolineales bacterium]